jgi:hypothetical protein
MSVSIKIEGLKEAQKFLRDNNVEKINQISNAVEKSSFFLKDEVQASISGHRAEQKSVDTGEFLRTVSNHNLSNFSAVIQANVGYAKFPENRRGHFANTAKRNKTKVRDYIEQAIAS